jgi:hypothetical protein
MLLARDSVGAHPVSDSRSLPVCPVRVANVLGIAGERILKSPLVGGRLRAIL